MALVGGGRSALDGSHHDRLSGVGMSSVQFVVELFEGDDPAALIGGASFADGCGFDFRQRVEWVGAFIELRGGVNGDGPGRTVNSTKSPGLIRPLW